MDINYKANKNKCLLSYQKKNKKRAGVFFVVAFFNTERMTLDCAYNERTETLYKNVAGIS